MIYAYWFAQAEHEDWCLSCQYHSQRQQACRLAWFHDRQELLTKVRHLFKEACSRKTAAVEVAKAREQQKGICQDLSDKVGLGHRLGVHCILC